MEKRASVTQKNLKEQVKICLWECHDDGFSGGERVGIYESGFLYPEKHVIHIDGHSSKGKNHSELVYVPKNNVSKQTAIQHLRENGYYIPE